MHSIYIIRRFSESMLLSHPIYCRLGILMSITPVYKYIHAYLNCLDEVKGIYSLCDCETNSGRVHYRMLGAYSTIVVELEVLFDRAIFLSAFF